MSEPLSLGFRLVVKLVRRLFPNVPRMTTDQLNEIMRRTSSHGEAETPGENLVLLNGWEFVPNTNITSAHLNTKGLHLIKSGTQDVREEFERDVSRIAGSIHVPPDTVRMSNVLTHVNQGESSKVVCYCAVGYRASIMADRILTELDKPDHKELRQLTRVYILEGSIFKWGNELKPLIDAHGSKTVHVHGVAAAWKLLLWPELRG
ncbi:uncharacterized protein LOC5525241 isoform X1 [Nematostella vectensis]|uniref:uncharacterized protein LOC5525241 isoform X1 n=1 Tax=Nematostella vectensis TaxID=45351 RepID=UPI00207752B0|nr:uncharacterized protein LOC5525241 isoform X1 [Nematostella vectensis]